MPPCTPFHCPAATITPTHRDWPILKTLHLHPKSDIAECAQFAGISPKTFSRRYNALVVGRAVWAIPLLNFTRYEGASLARLLVWLGPQADARAVIDRLEAEFPSFILLEHQSDLTDLGPEHPKLLSVLLRLASPGEVEDAGRVMLEVEGMVDVEAFSLDECMCSTIGSLGV